MSDYNPIREAREGGPHNEEELIALLADALEATQAELERLTEALKEIERLSESPSWDDPSAGVGPIARAALAAGGRAAGKPAPDYNPRVDHPERFSDGPY